MKSKLDLAHEMALELIKVQPSLMAYQIAERSFEYADAMYAEHEKREKQAAEEKRKQMRELLNASNTFIEKEGQHFDDVIASLENHECNFVYGRVCLCGKIKEEWQPDWSMAPDSKVQYFAVDESGIGGWYINKPELCFDHWYWSDFGERLDEYDNAPSFNYTGHWRDSLRKRPE